MGAAMMRDRFDRFESYDLVLSRRRRAWFEGKTQLVRLGTADRLNHGIKQARVGEFGLLARGFARDRK